MSEKPKKVLGIICLIISCFLIIGEISVITIPSVAQIANKSPGDHIQSIMIAFIIGAIGLHLRRGKN